MQTEKLLNKFTFILILKNQNYHLSLLLLLCFLTLLVVVVLSVFYSLTQAVIGNYDPLFIDLPG